MCSRVFNTNICCPGYPGTSHISYPILATVVWSNATKKYLHRFQIAQNKAARLALRCNIRSNTLLIHQNLSWLLVEQRLTASLAAFFRNICLNEKPKCLYNNIHYTRDRHRYNTRHVAMGRFTAPKPRTEAMKNTVMYRAMTFWNSLPVCITEIKGKRHFKERLKRFLINLE